MKEQIEKYEPKTPSIVAIGDRRIRAYIGDEHPHLGSTLWVGNTPTRIVALAGSGRVEAIAFDVGGLAVGDAVRCDDEVAAWPTPRPGQTALADLAFEPGRTGAGRRTAGAVAALHTGIEVIDELLPVAEHGVTLLLDCGAPDECTDRLLAALDCSLVCASTRVVPTATQQVHDSSGLALAVAGAWALEIDDSALLIEAPPFKVDALLDADSGVTTVVRVLLRDGLEILAETLDLGHCETQILLRPDGTIDLSRSTSRLRESSDLTERLAGIEAIRERLQIFGEHDVEEEDLALLREADALEAGLIR